MHRPRRRRRQRQRHQFWCVCVCVWVCDQEQQVILLCRETLAYNTTKSQRRRLANLNNSHAHFARVVCRWIARFLLAGLHRIRRECECCFVSLQRAARLQPRPSSTNNIDRKCCVYRFLVGYVCCAYRLFPLARSAHKYSTSNLTVGFMSDWRLHTAMPVPYI